MRNSVLILGIIADLWGMVVGIFRLRLYPVHGLVRRGSRRVRAG